MREVFASENDVRVSYYKTVLDAAGIENFIRDEFSSMTEFRLPPALCVVHDEDYDRAMQILGEIYNSQSVEAAEWKCAKCNAEVPANFGSCWQCDTLRTTNV